MYSFFNLQNPKHKARVNHSFQCVAFSKHGNRIFSFEESAFEEGRPVDGVKSSQCDFRYQWLPLSEASEAG